MTVWKNHLFEQWCMVEQERDEARAQRDQNFDVLNAAMNERNELVDDQNGLVDHIEVLQDQMQQLVEENQQLVAQVAQGKSLDNPFTYDKVSS